VGCNLEATVNEKFTRLNEVEELTRQEKVEAVQRAKAMKEIVKQGVERTEKEVEEKRMLLEEQTICDQKMAAEKAMALKEQVDRNLQAKKKAADQQKQFVNKKAEQDKKEADAKAKNLKEGIISTYECIKQEVDVALTEVDRNTEFLQEDSSAEETEVELEQDYKPHQVVNLIEGDYNVSYDKSTGDVTVESIDSDNDDAPLAETELGAIFQHEAEEESEAQLKQNYQSFSDENMKSKKSIDCTRKSINATINDNFHSTFEKIIFFIVFASLCIFIAPLSCICFTMLLGSKLRRHMIGFLALIFYCLCCIE